MVAITMAPSSFMTMDSDQLGKRAGLHEHGLEHVILCGAHHQKADQSDHGEFDRRLEELDLRLSAEEPPPACVMEMRATVSA